MSFIKKNRKTVMIAAVAVAAVAAAAVAVAGVSKRSIPSSAESRNEPITESEAEPEISETGSVIALTPDGPMFPKLNLGILPTEEPRNIIT